MAPTSQTAVTAALRQIIYYHLDNSSFDNALIFAERLSAQDPRSPESTYLLALIHLRLGDNRSAYEVSRLTGYRGVHLGCSWVFAQACLTLEKWKDGITALEKSRNLWTNKSSLGRHSASFRAPNPDAAAVLLLLGKLYRGGYGDKKKATLCFEESLRLNPFMWNAFTALCDMGVSVRVPNIFKVSETLIKSFDHEPPTTLELKENAGMVFVSETLPKKSTLRTVMDSNDPFESHNPRFNSMVSETTTALGLNNNNSNHNNHLNTNGIESEPAADFVSRLAAAKTRHANGINNPNSHVDIMETPTGPLSASDVSSRLQSDSEPPQAPPRRTRAAQVAESSLADVPPRMSYRLGSRKTARVGGGLAGAADKNTETEVAIDTNGSTATALATKAAAAAAADRKRTVSGHPVRVGTGSSSAGGIPNDEGQPHRRSARLNMFKPSTSKANSSSAAMAAGSAASRELKKARPPVSRIIRPGSSSAHVGRVVSGNRKPVEEGFIMDLDHAESSRGNHQQQTLSSSSSSSLSGTSIGTKSAEVDASRVEEVLKWTLDLLRRMGIGYQALSQFRCTDSIQAFNSLPKAQLETPWVQANIGRAHYELANYVEADKFFRKVRSMAPTRMDDMEVYSTILWHLKRDIDLSFLAHELIDTAWLSPQAWCALGNSWSLAKDQEQALRCFKRATHLDPNFAYAYTLQGHEHVASEEYEKAMTAYRQAMSADQRHYNAYYGIGRVHERLGNYDKAYTHFHAASVINPTNAVLLCCIGTVLEKQKQIMPALAYYTKAADLAPRAAQTRYKKARALLAIGNLEAAQRELTLLKDLAPDGARVHFLLGKLYRDINEKQLAVRHYSTALALDPKAAAQIKEAIEGLEDDVGMDDSV